MIVRLRAAYEKARSSLFWVPAGYVALTLLLATATTWVEQNFELAPYSLVLFEANAESVRSVLQTVATATITVAGLVFPVMVVALQLASSQFSPRVLRGFLRDRVIQHVLGFVVGTFSFSMILLASTAAQQGAQPDQAGSSLAVTLAAVMAVATMLAIVAFIHHAVRYMQVVEIIRRTTEETRARIADLLPPRDRDEERPDPPDGRALPETDPVRFRAAHDGWVQQIDDSLLLAAVPAGAVARVDVRPGDFVVEEQSLVTAWLADGSTGQPDGLDGRVREAFAIGSSRTMQQDVVYGIRQIVDIALRALSPAINDPTTAYEVTVNLGAILRDILTRDLRPRVIAGEDGRIVYRPHELTHADYVAHAFDQLRLSAGPHPVAARNIIVTIGRLVDLLRERGLEDRIEPLLRQVRLTVEAVQANEPLEHDRREVVDVAAAVLSAELGTRRPDALR